MYYAAAAAAAAAVCVGEDAGKMFACKQIVITHIQCQGDHSQVDPGNRVCSYKIDTHFYRYTIKGSHNIAVTCYVTTRG